MLSPRLMRGPRPLSLLRRGLVVAASAGTGFLLLSAVGHALGHPQDPSAGLVRLAWCVVPLAAAVHLTVAVSRGETGHRPHPGLIAAGLGRSWLPVLAAVSTAVSSSLGSLIALGVFLWLRGRLVEAVPLPVAGIATLLVVLPLAGTTGSLVALRRRRRPPTVAGLPWGVALTAAGLAVEVYASHWTRPAAGTAVPLPGGLGSIAPAVLLGWLLTAAGLVLAGPGLVHFGGRLLAAFRPGAVRLLAGRTLQTQAARVGRPLGVLCAVASAALAATVLHGVRPFGPLTGLGAALVLACTTATACTAVTGSPAAAEVLGDLAAPARVSRLAALLRLLVVLAVLAPVTWSVAQLAALPLTR
ncbi:hypothetical protein ACFOSC_28440 [Streptantibioticus rubrisoli]|uniref:Integral membrane protein n=1 Tax=Streptantibioticus rubrisoli TaxID=1387313 RepID=A0ABT1PE34_9ACTN|nr:hypothetical protein [Streptantibioticus rubrisoli]MCQ4043627.1 hypothetical protein [Streptantibioticus rubrisoli]